MAASLIICKLAAKDLAQRNRYSHRPPPSTNAPRRYLRDTVGALIHRFTPAEYTNYFRAAGYDPD